MARIIALMALTTLGLSGAPVHDHYSEHLMSTTERVLWNLLRPTGPPTVDTP